MRKLPIFLDLKVCQKGDKGQVKGRMEGVVL